jgi:hypothetical protein
MRISFEEYAYRSAVENLAKHVLPIALTVAYNKSDLTDLFQMTKQDLVRRPVHEAPTINAEGLSIADFGLQTSGSSDPRFMNPKLYLPAGYASMGLLATAGYQIAICCSKQNPDGQLQLDKKLVGLLETDVFTNYERNLLEGARVFYSQISSQLQEPDRVVLFSLMKREKLAFN